MIDKTLELERFANKIELVSYKYVLELLAIAPVNRVVEELDKKIRKLEEEVN